RRNTLPADVAPLPGIDPDISQSMDLFEAEHTERFGFPFWRAAVVAGTAAAMIAAATGLLGMGESPPDSNQNAVVTWYNRSVAKIGAGPWCDMGITWEAWHSGNVVAVCGGPGRGFALTTAHAADFRRRGLWMYGARGIRPGDVVFFSWSRGETIGSIDHVGLVEHVYADGSFTTIECNIGNACRREHRDATYVVGYGRPPYASSPTPAPAAAGGTWFLGGA
ncbi:CHAP domain-containing protein, partial [Actinoallomurus sp. NPDC052274]|uniref:CHAP domain-containing protein n=1 Tax=Actinoallomurus sp. NPDC052274 TaxID=3155420 RepID=UPI00342CBF37